MLAALEGDFKTSGNATKRACTDYKSAISQRKNDTWEVLQKVIRLWLKVRKYVLIQPEYIWKKKKISYDIKGLARVTKGKII